MVKFPTPGGISTVMARPAMVSECRRLEQDQAAITPMREEHREGETVEEEATEEVLVNPAFPEQRVTIEKDSQKRAEGTLLSF